MSITRDLIIDDNNNLITTPKQLLKNKQKSPMQVPQLTKV